MSLLCPRSTTPAGLQQPLLCETVPVGQDASAPQEQPLSAPVLLGQDASGSGSAKEASRSGSAKRPEEARRGGTMGHPEEARRGGSTARPEDSGSSQGLWHKTFAIAEVFLRHVLDLDPVMPDHRPNTQGTGNETPEAAARLRHEDEARVAMPSAPLLKVMATMSKYGGNDIAEAGCQRLCELQAQQEEGLLAAGAAELVLRAMERHKGDRSLPIQEAGVRFLRDAASTRDGQVKVAAAGGCQAVLRAMSGRAALASPSMQELGCGAVLNLARDHSEGGSKGHAAWKVGMKGGVGAVLEAMKASEEHPRVQERACAALRTLMLDQGNQVTVLENDGMQAMLHAAAMHSADADVVREACSALLLLAKDYSDSRPKMAAAGARDAIAQCASDHGGDAAVQAASRSLLKILGSATGAPSGRRPAAADEAMQS